MLDLPNFRDKRWRGLRDKNRRQFNPSSMTLTVEVCHNGEDCAVELPAKYEVCPTCNGHGSHVNPNIDDNGITAEEFARDPGFAEDYLRGTFSVTCYGCDGTRVVPAPNREKMSPEELDYLLAHEEVLADLEEMDRTMAREQSMGA